MKSGHFFITLGTGVLHYKQRIQSNDLQTGRLFDSGHQLRNYDIMKMSFEPAKIE